MTLTDDQIERIAERVAAKLRAPEKKAYTLAEAARALSVSPATVRRMLDAGLLRRLRGTAKPIIPSTELDKLLSNHGSTH